MWSIWDLVCSSFAALLVSFWLVSFFMSVLEGRERRRRYSLPTVTGSFPLFLPP
jgi:hypothetical protein